jgi:hypothetical protein
MVQPAADYPALAHSKALRHRPGSKTGETGPVSHGHPRETRKPKSRAASP